jgi:hypothetical protein
MARETQIATEQAKRDAGIGVNDITAMTGKNSAISAKQTQATVSDTHRAFFTGVFMPIGRLNSKNGVSNP